MPYRPPPGGPAPPPGALGPTKPPKQKKPAPPPRSGEDVRQQGLAKQAKQASQTTQPSFSGPPIPTLQKYGYSGSINDVNARVQGIFDAFQTRFGTTPSPGHVFDVLVSPVNDFNTLYADVPRSGTQARLAGSNAQNREQNPYEYRVKDANGNLQWQTPLTKLIQDAAALPDTPPPSFFQSATGQTPADLRKVEKGVQEKKRLRAIQKSARGAFGGTPDPFIHKNYGAEDVRYQAPQGPPKPPTEAQQQTSFNKLVKSHPWVPVQSGFLPLPGFFDFVNAVGETQKQGFPTDLKVGGETLAQARSKLAQSETSNIEAPLAQQLTMYGKTAGVELNKGVLTPGQAAQQLEQGKARSAVVTIKAGQQYLQNVSPAYFSDLPASGYMSSDWAHRLKQWQATGDYFRQSTQRLAQENGFGDRTDVFVKAWQAKQQAIRKNPFAAHVIQNIPLNWFALNAIKPGVGGNRLSGLRFAVEGPSRAGWHLITPTGLLGGLVTTAKLAVDVASGTFQQGEADSAFTTTYMRQVTESAWKPGMTEAKARASAREQLLANPSALRVAMAGSLPEHPTGNLAIANAVSEVAFDIAISNPRVWGTKVKPGDVKGILNNTYFQSKAPWAFQSLKDGNLGEAVRTLGRTRMSENLSVKLGPLVREGKLSQTEFENILGQAYAHGKATLPDGTIVHGDGILPELRSWSMPTAGPAGQMASEGWARTRKAMDHFDQGLRSSGAHGTNNAADFLSFARSVFTRAAPKGTGLTERQRYLFADRTPDDIYNFTTKNFRGLDEVKNPTKLAEQWRDEFITARATDNVRGMVAVQDKLSKLYYKTHPNATRGVKGLGEAGEGPQLLSEAPSYFTFPVKQYKALGADAKAWDKLAYYSGKVNARLNKLAAFHRQLIVSGVPFGGVSLAWKHATSDTLRRLVGGGGPLFGATKDTREARAFLDAHFKDNPSAMRFVGAEQSAAKLGEYRYMVRQGLTDKESFSTGEVFGQKNESGHLLAAGQDLRHLLTDDALNAYMQSSKDHLAPLEQFVQRDSFHRQSWLGSEAYKEDLAKLGESPAKENVRELRQEYSTAHAEAVYNRYRGLEEALQASGTDLNAASQVMRGNIGASADKALADFIKDNRVDYSVRQGLVAEKRIDDAMQRWIGLLMTANKWNRGKMFDHVFHTTFWEFHNAGWETGDAIQAATLVGKRQTVYHMLDFSNMLQVEQDLRWMSYFATKHRLYWTWIAKTMFSRPGLANLVHQIGNQLGYQRNGQHVQDGNLHFTVAGRKFFIPVGRLVWVNSHEYPETSPVLQGFYSAGQKLGKGESAANAIQAGFGSVAGTSGNVITRSDQAIQDWVKLGLVETGHAPATYAATIHGMGAKQAQDFNRRYNEFQIQYFHEHGTYAPEPVAVKHTLLWSSIWETQRSNMFVPVMEDTSKPAGIQKLFDQFDKIQSPLGKRKFLDAHPALEDWFSIYKDPELRQHVNDLWARYQVAEDAYSKAQSALLDQVVTTGVFTPQTANQLKALSDKRAKVIAQLKAQDAAWSGSPGYKKAKGQPGPWTKQLEGDPLATRGTVARLFPNVSLKELEHGTIGQTYQDLVSTRDLLVKRKSQYDPTHYKEILGEINQKLSIFYGTSTKPLPAAEHQYYSEHVNPYINERQAKLNAVNSTIDPQSGGLVLDPKTGQYQYKPSLDRLETEFRAWRDAHDKPVTIMVHGKPVKFPSPVKMGWLRLTPDLRKTYLAQLAGDSYDHIADYEKQLLGFKVYPHESDGWLAYTKILDLYEREAALQGSSINAKDREYIARLVQHGFQGYSGVHPDFLKAYRFSQRPKYQRVEQTSLIKTSQYPDQWKRILGTADYFWRGIQKGSPQRQTQAVYREYVNGQQFQSWLNTQPVGFRKELSLFGPNLLNTLTSS